MWTAFQPRDRRRSWLPIALVVLGLATAASAQTTGSLAGVVTDETNAPLPGVIVTVSAQNLIGSRSVTTELDGGYRFPSLPPGTYQIEAALDGFNPARKEGVHVGIDRTVKQDLMLRLQSEQVEVTVIAEAPVVDLASTETGANITRELFETLPMDRNFTAIVAVAPGTSSDGAGTTVYGSTGAENTYIIDGLNSTDISHGIEGKNMNLEFIQEVEVKTGGYQAEYGRATGGIINVVTKSGGNEFSGDVFFYHDNDAFQGSSIQATGEGNIDAATFNVFTGFDRDDYGIDLGGYIVKDRLWFFAAYDRVDRTNMTVMLQNAPESQVNTVDPPFEGIPLLESPQEGEHLDTQVVRDLYAGKLTWRITDNATAIFSANADPREIEGAGRGAGPYTSILYNFEDGATDFVGKFDYVSGSSLLLNFLVGQHNEMEKTTPATEYGGVLPYFVDYVDARFLQDGGIGFLQDEEYSRTVARVDLTSFVQGLGDHELKFGLDYELNSAELNNGYTGIGGSDDVRLLPHYTRREGSRDYVHEFYLAPGANLDDGLTPDDVRSSFQVDPETKNLSVYMQDTWKLGTRLTMNLGLRWEQQKLLDQEGNARIKIDDAFAPRLGLIWDVTGTGRSKLFASYGFFYESIPMDINVRALGGETTAQVYNNDRWDPLANPNAIVIFSSEGSPIDEGLKGQYIAEAILGYEWAVSTKFGVGVKGIYRTLERIIEDRFAGFDANGNPIYGIGNPGRGDFTTGLFCEQTGCYQGLTPEEQERLWVAVPDPKREYKAFEISVNKRLSDNWQALASYVYSKLEGNYDGAFQASTGQLDPNINSAYDYANFILAKRDPECNFPEEDCELYEIGNGYLTGDSRHQFKLNASYTFPFKVTTGFTFEYATGVPFNRYGFWDGYRNWEVFLDQRGSLGRQPDSYELDLHFSYPFDIGPTIAQIELDVFNFLNRQGGVYRQEIWSLTEGGNDESTPDIATYGHMVAYQAPTYVRISARLTF